MMTPPQLADVVSDCYTCRALARGYFIAGDDELARKHAAISRHAQRRIRAHVRERRRRLRAVLARSEHNIIGRMVVERILREEMDPR
jgi:hypothetical protein